MTSRTVFTSALLVLAFVATAPASVFAKSAELPRVFIDTSLPYAKGSPPRSTITVNAGGDLQAALNAARPGDEIVLQAGATFTGTFTLLNKGAGKEWIIIRSSAESPNKIKYNTYLFG